MPIYMDRHDVTLPTTAEDIARLHQEDLKIQNEFGCKGMTYWFDDIRKIAFCLIEAPNAKAIKEMHDHAHGQVPHAIIEVDAAIVESFLGRIGDPEKKQDTGLNIIDEPAFRTIVVISLHPLSPPNKSAEAFNSAFSIFNENIRKILKDYDGSTVRQTDYYYLVSFKSVTNAVRAALNVQLLNKEFNRSENEKIILKMGVNAGVPVTKKQLIFEDTIRLAERMCRIVKGEVIVSSEVKELYKNENADTLMEDSDVFVLTQAEEKFLLQLVDYTGEVFRNPDFNANSFIRSLGCSKSQLYRRMIALTGKAPNAFIQDYRLDEAMKLLRKNAGNISEIAFETGFSSPSYFTKCFKKKFGVLPAVYIKSPQ